MTQLPAVQRKFLRGDLRKTDESKAALRRLASALRRIRREHPMTASELAANVGCSVQTISDIEHAKSWPSMPLYVRICGVLGLGRPPLI